MNPNAIEVRGLHKHFGAKPALKDVSLAVRPGEMLYGVIPQVLPLWISYALYRFEANVRSASVVGMVGAGGIGMVLWDVIRGFQYAQTAAVLMMLVVAVSLIDMASSRLRKLAI
jgi:phosphonate transport system permease protein